MAALVNKNRVDVVACFLHFVAAVGDCEKVALAMDLNPEVVRQLAVSEGWDEKIRRLSLVSKGSGMAAGDYERAQNRALNWVQSFRLRQILDRVICHFSELTPEETVSEITTRDRDGNMKISARFFTDLAKSLECVHGMSYAALNDTVPERQKMTGDEKANTQAVHLALLQALNGPGVKSIPSEVLVAETAKAIGAITVEVITESSEVIAEPKQITQ